MKFLGKYNNKKNLRFDSFNKTLKLCLKNKNIVETGTARGKQNFFFNQYNWKDGMSTSMFAEYAKIVGGRLHTCDISRNNIETKFVKKYSEFIKFYIQDSVNFNNFETKLIFFIELLDGHDPIMASEHQLNEARVVLGNYTKNVDFIG